MSFMHEHHSSMELLKNNGKMIGGVIGAETEFFGMKEKFIKVDDKEFFLSKTALEL